MNIKLFIFLMILLSACSSQDNRLEYALRFAESNKTPLNKFWLMPLKENPFTEMTC